MAWNALGFARSPPVPFALSLFSKWTLHKSFSNSSAPSTNSFGLATACRKGVESDEPWSGRGPFWGSCVSGTPFVSSMNST